jgi:hypothetical protein
MRRGLKSVVPEKFIVAHYKVNLPLKSDINQIRQVF